MGTPAKTRPCIYNEGCACDPNDDCSKCGWNPKVEAKRYREMLKKYGIVDIKQ